MNSNKGKVLVTGAGGFIGSQLAERLVEEGYEVTAFLHYNSRQEIGLLDYCDPRLLKEIKIHFGDLKDANSISDAVKGKDFVFHLGALIGIPYSYRNPRDVVETNVLGTLNVVMAAKEYGVRRVIHTSTSEVYGTAQTNKIHEGHPLQSQSPYSASKTGADKIIESFVASYQLPAVTIRPFNTYGPRQSMRAVIPTIIGQALFQEEICVGSLEPVRDFTYVRDTVDAFLLGAVQEGIEGKLFNLGSDQEVSVRDVIKMVLRITGNEDKPVRSSPQRIRPPKSEVLRLRSDRTFAKQILGWEPKTLFEEGLRETVEWIKKYPQKYSDRNYVV